jgi:hypothetical protein
MAIDEKRKYEKRKYERTIALDLFEAWGKLTRNGDKELMAKTLGYSHVIIGRALKWGHVSKPELINKINKFFMERLTKEKADASTLNKLADEVAKIN